jgi:peptide/nickel transport system ATP-binding protein
MDDLNLLQWPQNSLSTMANNIERPKVLEVRSLLVEFIVGDRPMPAVRGISFSLGRGETLGIVGESGSGKSVTALAIMGLLPKTAKVSGEIMFSGTDRHGNWGQTANLRGLPERILQSYRGSQIGLVFQEPMSALNPVFTIGFQLTEAILQHRPMATAAAKAEVVARLQEVQLIPSDEELSQQYLQKEPSDSSPAAIEQFIRQFHGDYLDRYPHQLSGGQLQRVSIAMAISCDPVLLIADEPTTALDVTVQAEILTLLRQLQTNRQMSMIFVSHDLAVVSSVADRVAVMYQGKIVELQPTRQLFQEPEHVYTKGLLACRPRLDCQTRYLPTVEDFMGVVSRSIGGAAIKSQSDNAWIDDREVNRELDRSLVSNVDKKQPPLLSVANLRVGFPTKRFLGSTLQYNWAVNDVSFEVAVGETLGLVGESGCGKSTLSKTLLRLIDPSYIDDGVILFENQNVLELRSNALQKLRREMQIVFQNPMASLNPRLAVGDAVMEPLRLHQKLFKKKEHSDRAAYLFERVGLNPSVMNRYPHEFSGGQRQRICIARALALNPRFIICDEAVSALDVSVQAQVLNLLKELQGEFNLTYIFISHDLSVVKFMSDRIMVMNRGKIEEIGEAENIYTNPEKEYTRKLIASIPKGFEE